MADVPCVRYVTTCSVGSGFVLFCQIFCDKVLLRLDL